MGYWLNDREVDVGGIDYIHGEGGTASDARWIDTGEELTDDELRELSEMYACEFDQEGFEQAASRAEDWADARDDR